MAPVLEAAGERLFYQKSNETGAIDEKPPLNLPAVCQPQAADISVFGLPLYLDYASLHAHDAAFLRIAAKVARVKTGIEMICISESRMNTEVGGCWRGETVEPGGHTAQ